MSASESFIRGCNPGFKSWEEPKVGKMSELAIAVMRNYYERKHKRSKKHSKELVAIDWNEVAERLTGKKLPREGE